MPGVADRVTVMSFEPISIAETHTLVLPSLSATSIRGLSRPTLTGVTGGGRGERGGRGEGGK